jgi:hypothetical protein
LIPSVYASREAYEPYIANNPNNESRFIYPIIEGEWEDDQSSETVADGANEWIICGQMRPIPSLDEYTQRGITLENPPRIQVFELCRCVADNARESVLASPKERRITVLPRMTPIQQPEEWHRPSVVENDHLPSGSETFQQLAQVLATGNVALYQPSRLPNSHWKNWPDGGLW